MKNKAFKLLKIIFEANRSTFYYIIVSVFLFFLGMFLTASIDSFFGGFMQITNTINHQVEMGLLKMVLTIVLDVRIMILIKNIYSMILF